MGIAFNNLDELKEMIKEGKTNEEIINSRIEYLSSEEYKKTRELIKDDNDAIIYYDGFITEDITDTFTSEATRSTGGTSYKVTSNKYYDDIINVVRQNMDIKLIELITCAFNYTRKKLLETPPEKLELYRQLQKVKLDLAQKKLEDYKSKYDSNPSQNKHNLLDIYEDDVRIFEGQLDKKPTEFRQEMLTNFEIYNALDYDGDFEEFCKARYIYSKYREYKEIIDADENYSNMYNKFVAAKSKMRKESPVDLSEIEGYGTAACVEMSMLAQNLLTFFGINSYRLNGFANHELNLHAFNVVTGNEKYTLMFDTALMCYAKIDNKVLSKEQIKNIKNLELPNTKGEIIKYTTECSYVNYKQSELASMMDDNEKTTDAEENVTNKYY